jgi:hypothetical protein
MKKPQRMDFPQIAQIPLIRIFIAMGTIATTLLLIGEWKTLE